MYSVISVVLAFVLAAVVAAQDMNPCEVDINNICGTPFPTSYQSIFEARLCLRSNSKAVSESCKAYLTTESPSIIEPCFEELGKYCKNVAPGSNRINNCLIKYSSELSHECLSAVHLDATKNSENLSERKLAKNSNIYLSNFENLQIALTDLSRYDIIRGAGSVFQGFYDRLNEVEVSLQDIMESMATKDTEVVHEPTTTSNLRASSRK